MRSDSTTDKSPCKSPTKLPKTVFFTKYWLFPFGISTLNIFCARECYLSKPFDRPRVLYGTCKHVLLFGFYVNTFLHFLFLRKDVFTISMFCKDDFTILFFCRNVFTILICCKNVFTILRYELISKRFDRSPILQMNWRSQNMCFNIVRSRSCTNTSIWLITLILRMGGVSKYESKNR